MRGPQGVEWLILLAIVLLLFGARRLPDLARSVGRSMKIFRSEVSSTGDDTSPGDEAPSGGDASAPHADDGDHPRPCRGPVRTRRAPQARSDAAPGSPA